MHWEATIVDEDAVNVQSTNVLVEDDVVALEVAAAGEIGEVVGVPLGAGNLDRGSAPVVLGDDDQVLCSLTDPANGDIYDTTLTITDMASGAFEFEVAEKPR